MENHSHFNQFISDSKKYSTEDFYNKYHKIIGHSYYMVMIDNPKDKYFSSISFTFLKFFCVRDM